ncbi:hypothetical protein RHMOL_Rhmol12G0167800 [Rhododendron molle]|uniref:Uncharacterized protein n=1 Tax=Rhododendron molle TaxID=49168 RepID=A0ACC0LJ96_RHOML|nr:hypothetical protein RHMOL_Rhmol12G0167800 [Rhododendron molle]
MELKMAEVVISKTCTFSSSCSSIQHHKNGISTFPVKSTMVSSEMGFPSLKIATISKKGNTRLSSPSPLYAQMSIGIIGKAQKIVGERASTQYEINKCRWRSCGIPLECWGQTGGC